MVVEPQAQEYKAQATDKSQTPSTFLTLNNWYALFAPRLHQNSVSNTSNFARNHRIRLGLEEISKSDTTDFNAFTRIVCIQMADSNVKLSV